MSASGADPRLSSLRAAFQALFGAGSAIAEWDEDRFERFIRIVEETGLLLFGYPKRWTDEADVFGVLDTINVEITNAHEDLVAARRGLQETLDELRAAESAHIVSTDRQVPDVGGNFGAEDIPETIPVAAPAPPPELVVVPESIVETQSIHASPLPELVAIDEEAAPEPTSTVDAREPSETPEDVKETAPEPAVGPSDLTCADCGREFLGEQGLRSHRRTTHSEEAWVPPYDVNAMYEALRSTGSIGGTARELGLTDQAIRFRLDKLQSRGMLPDDIAAMRRAPTPNGKVVELDQADWPKPLPVKTTAPDDFDTRRREHARQKAAENLEDRRAGLI